MKTLPNKPIILRDNLFSSVNKIVNHNHNGSSIVVPHVCNNINAFGGGFTAGITKYYPIVKENYHLLGGKNSLGYVQFVEVSKNHTYGHKLIFANMIAQNGLISKSNPRPLNYAALVKCMISVSSFVNDFINNNKENTIQIHAPKFGSGLAGGNWNFITDLIFDIWKNHTVFIYDLKKT